MNIYDKILCRPEFINNPPVLLDIGAAGEIHSKWQKIAKHSICIAFDADEREMGYVIKEASGYRKLYVYNCIASDTEQDEMVFYLTKSPQCSSRLKPSSEKLSWWAFADLFEVERATTLKSVSLASVLAETGIRKIDWFKSDSQGTDLRLFKSLGVEMERTVLAAEFEPGIIDAYEGEDKLHALMRYMDSRPFWISSLKVKGSQRIKTSNLNYIEKKFIAGLLTASPGWGEISYLNSFELDAVYLDKRDYLLGWLFATIEKQYGFAREIAYRGGIKFNDPVFSELEAYALMKLRCSVYKLVVFICSYLLRKLFR